MLSDKERVILNSYERKLQKPKWQFIVGNGLVWGFLVFVIMFLERYFLRGKSLKEQWNDGLAIDLIFLPFAGLLYGWLIRTLINRKYQQLKQKDLVN